MHMPFRDFITRARANKNNHPFSPVRIMKLNPMFHRKGRQMSRFSASFAAHTPMLTIAVCLSLAYLLVSGSQASAAFSSALAN
jgi:hypothetical protein